MSEQEPKIPIIVVTASTDLNRAVNCIHSWLDAPGPDALVIVHNGPRRFEVGGESRWPGILATVPDYLGSVPAFAYGLQLAKQLALQRGWHNALAACFHDDLEILDPQWAAMVRDVHAQTPGPLLSGFFGARGLGRDDIYSAPYDPYQLVREACISNMRDAEAHGARCTTVERVAVLDGFSQIGCVFTLARWFSDLAHAQTPIIHHAYDAAMGIFAATHGVEVKMIPIACHHHGGQTAVGDPGYAEWAQSKGSSDAKIWEDAHRVVYELGRGILPIRVS